MAPKVAPGGSRPQDSLFDELDELDELDAESAEGAEVGLPTDGESGHEVWSGVRRD